MKNSNVSRPIPRVMLVENDRTLLTMLANSLAQFGQNITAIANNSSDAIKLFQKVNPEVVVLDIDLGDSIDGIELANIMQKSNPNIGVVFLTSFTDHRFAFIIKSFLKNMYIYESRKLTMSKWCRTQSLRQQPTHKNTIPPGR